ncbi:phospholipase A2 inhibitor NAI-like isoform X1 [Ranitomeya imitator]|uniref:phospholipase A2 inhibitor NAI-like isoform X1 n=1 Tax=Ranitomeya imitator TaxID=111125 RepID=UPI0037E8E2AF
MCLWGLLCFLSAFAATGNCLQCVTCSSNSLNSCSSTNSVSCQDGQVCASQSTVTMQSGEFSQYFKRFCAPQSECNVTGSFSYYSTAQRIATTCCFSDLCSPKNPIVPSANSQINGVICSMCSLSGDACGANQNMNCTGNETMCMVMSTKYTVGTQVTLSLIRGCASSNYCIRSNITFPSNEGQTEITYQCTAGTLANSSSTATRATSTTTSTKASSGTCRCSVSLLAVFFLFILLWLI